MATIFMRFMDILRRKKTRPPETHPETRGAPESERAEQRDRAERGLALSDLDGDPRTSQALSDVLGIRTRVEGGPGKKAA